MVHVQMCVFFRVNYIQDETRRSPVPGPTFASACVVCRLGSFAYGREEYYASLCRRHDSKDPSRKPDAVERRPT
jgi:hypothetical protein